VTLASGAPLLGAPLLVSLPPREQEFPARLALVTANSDRGVACRNFWQISRERLAREFFRSQQLHQDALPLSLRLGLPNRRDGGKRSAALHVPFAGIFGFDHSTRKSAPAQRRHGVARF